MPPTTCPSGETLSNGQCVPPTTCPTGETLTGGVCTPPTVVPPPAVYPAVCRASTKGYKVRAGQQDTIIVSVTRNGAAVAGANVRVITPRRQDPDQEHRQQRQGDVHRQADAERDHHRAQPELQWDGQGEGVRREGGDGGAGSVLHRLT